MGVSTNVYTVYGVRIAWNNEFSDAVEDGDLYSEFEDYTIFDGMGGDYIVIGAKLFDSGDSRWGEMSGFGVIELDSLPARKAQVVDKFNELLPEWSKLLDGDWKLMTFVHYH